MTCPSGQELNTSTCTCENSCPIYDKLYVIRYKGLQKDVSGKNKSTLYQQMMGTAIDNVEFLYDKNNYKLNVTRISQTSDTARNKMPQEMKDAAENLTSTDKNRNFTTYIAYIVGVKDKTSTVVAAYTPRTWGLLTYNNPIENSSGNDVEASDDNKNLFVAVPDSDYKGNNGNVKFSEYISYDSKYKPTGIYTINKCKRTQYNKKTTTNLKTIHGHIGKGEQVQANICKNNQCILVCESQLKATQSACKGDINDYLEKSGSNYVLKTGWSLHPTAAPAYWEVTKKEIAGNENLKNCIELMNAKDSDTVKYSNFVAGLKCRAEKNIKDSYDSNYFKGYDYDNSVAGCRTTAGSAWYDFDYSEEYNKSCKELCTKDRAGSDPLCISSCENISITENIFTHGSKASSSLTTHELYKGGKIRLNKGCSETNVAYSFLRYNSPLVLDLLGNGLKFTSVDDGVFFDLDADGFPERIAWTAKQTDFDDAFLIYDKNKNGQVDNGKELFGDQSGAKNGFHELSKYDKNSDKVINKDDPIWTKLRLWADMNKNAKVDTGEIKTLDEANITEIPLEYETKFDDNGNILTDIWGNITGIAGHFKMMIQNAAGKLVEVVRDMIDVFFASK